MSEQLTHSVPLFEGASSRRHQDRDVADLRADAAAYAGAPGSPDVTGVRTLVQFAGFPRSGHSLVGSLIDAHPDAVVAHELDLMGLVGHGLSRDELFALLCSNSAEFERHGRHWNGYAYRVPTGTGGTSSRPTVLGDKKADWAVRRVREDPDLLRRLSSVLDGVRAAWVVVVRNPFDNVATMSLRDGRAYDRIRIASASPREFRRRLTRAQRRRAEEGRDGPRVPAAVLPEMVEDYAGLCAGVAAMQAHVRPEDWLVLRHEDLVADPVPTLGRLFGFLGLTAAPALLQATAGAVSSSPHLSRHDLAWSDATLARVEELTLTHDFLRGYAFDDQ